MIIHVHSFLNQKPKQQMLMDCPLKQEMKIMKMIMIVFLFVWKNQNPSRNVLKRDYVVELVLGNRMSQCIPHVSSSGEVFEH